MGDHAVELLKVLFPYLSQVMVYSVVRIGRSVRITARCIAATARCPGCGRVSVRVHSRYGRRLADGAVGGQETAIILEIRRFFCDHTVCMKKTFAEQVERLTFRYGRRTVSLQLGCVSDLSSIEPGCIDAEQRGELAHRRVRAPVGRYQQNAVLQRQAPWPAAMPVGHSLAAYGDHQLAEAARAQPGERTYPGRLRRCDHTIHTKIISPVTKRYGQSLVRCRRWCVPG